MQYCVTQIPLRLGALIWKRLYYPFAAVARE
jgi:hypothetical protein